jgi:hypothetical protein
MTFRKATTAELTKLVNHEAIFPAMGHPAGAVLDCRDLYRTEGNIGFTTDIGGLFFENKGEGVFEIHFLFLPRSGGAAIKRVAKAMLGEMFTNRGACVIRGHPPRDNRAVSHIGYSLGFRRIDTDDFIDGNGRVCLTYELRK